jgi:hypothetical protein
MIVRGTWWPTATSSSPTKGPLSGSGSIKVLLHSSHIRKFTPCAEHNVAGQAHGASSSSLIAISPVYLVWEGKGASCGNCAHGACHHDQSYYIPHPSSSSPFVPPINNLVDTHKAVMDIFAPDSQELRELIQGPGDVEWRYVPPLNLPEAGRGRLSSAGTTCDINARRSYPASYSAHSKSPRT